MRKINIICFALVAIAIATKTHRAVAQTPNVIIVLTDDQGYGDLGCTGNPIIKTPNIDQLASESTGLSDYHVAPTCSPTRCSLLTGHWTNRTGVWHTIMGRSMLRENEVTVGQMFADAGYETGMFGKWHLGDNYPYRPEDRGFTEVYRHGGGGVGQTPDVWDNAYFDGAYFHNRKIVPAKGFCTDVFFEQANQFITRCADQKKPFFAYISTNAPHKPLHCPPEYMEMYKGQSDKIAAFYGMLTNIDDNVGQTRQLIEKLGIADNTIFIFTSDNGTASGAKVYNAGMRAGKGSPYEGGHRVPFFVHWPNGGLTVQHDVNELTHMVDIVPTLLEVTGVKKPDHVKFDGVSIADLIDPTTDVEWPKRFVISDSQRVRDPIKWRGSAVMTGKYRLVNRKELYDVSKDPGQRNNIADKNPEIVAEMREFYENWWAELEPTFSQTTEIHLGHADHPVVTLTAHDWIQEVYPPWHQGAIRAAERKQEDDKKLKHLGYWAVKVLKDGKYEISLRRWPAESGVAINASLPAGASVPGPSPTFRSVPGESIDATQAVLRIDGKDLDRKPVTDGAEEISFVTNLKKGSHQLAPVFEIPEGELGAYYVVVTSISEENSLSSHQVDEDAKLRNLWTQFRGSKNGHADPNAHPPIEWDNGQVAWETDIPGTGWSSPVYQGEQAWLTSAITTPLSEAEIAEKVGDPKAGGGKTVAGSLTLLAICVDLETGELLHNITLKKVADPQPINPLNSYASPTPAIADGKIIFHFGTYGTWCFDVETGEKIWETQFPVQHGVGPGSSPIICDGKVIITSDGTDLQYIAAADLETGDHAWKTDRPPFRTESGDHRKAYSTPLAIEVDGRTQLVIPGAQWIASYDPADGKELWRVDHGAGFSTIPMAVFEDDLVICPSGYPKLEFIAINPHGSGDVTQSNIVWRGKSAPAMPCYLVSAGKIYSVSNNGVLYCLDAKTGEELKRIRVGGNFSSSPLLAGGNLYLGNREGKMTIVKCSPELEKVGSHEFGDAIMASPIVVGDDLLIRTDKKLIRIKAQ